MKLHTPTKQTLNKWARMTNENRHYAVRTEIAHYFGHAIDPHPDEPERYGRDILEALKWIENYHNKTGHLELGLFYVRNIVTHYMLDRIGTIYGEKARQTVNACL